MNTRSAPELPATKVNWWRAYLELEIITAIMAGVIIAFVWAYVQAANTAATKATAIADRQQSKRSELSQARERWEARTFDNYRLHIRFGSSDGPYCQKVFEVHEPGQTNIVSDTCAGRDDSSIAFSSQLLRFLDGGGSVSGLFSYIDYEISKVGECVGACCYYGRTIDVVYDTNDGYPKSVERRVEIGWPTEERQGCPEMPPDLLPSPFTVSVNPIE